MHLEGFDFGSAPRDVPDDQAFIISLPLWSVLDLLKVMMPFATNVQEVRTVS
jgi:hypothetical protein